MHVLWSVLYVTCTNDINFPSLTSSSDASTSDILVSRMKRVGITEKSVVHTQYQNTFVVVTAWVQYILVQRTSTRTYVLVCIWRHSTEYSISVYCRCRSYCTYCTPYWYPSTSTRTVQVQYRLNRENHWMRQFSSVINEFTVSTQFLSIVRTCTLVLECLLYTLWVPVYVPYTDCANWVATLQVDYDVQYLY